MRKVMRYEGNQEYWDRRWAETGRDPDSFSDLNIYPIKYAELVMNAPPERAVELGVGLGRVLKHYFYRGRNIIGLERSEVAVRQLKEDDRAINVQVGDVTNLPYGNNEFDVVLAFGLFHNLEHEMAQALAEAARCLKPNGRFCISMRPDNFEMNLNEQYWRWKQKRCRNMPLRFHKWLVSEKEFPALLARYGLKTTELFRARNLSVLYRIPLLRAKRATKIEQRGSGYRLNMLGNTIDKFLVTLMPEQFCNVLVFIGRKQS